MNKVPLIPRLSGLALLLLGIAGLYGAEIRNIFPDGDFHNQNIIYRAIGPAKGLVRYVNEGPDGGTALLVKNSSGGNFRAYSGQVISLNQKQPMPLTFSFRGKRTGEGKTLAALDAVITFNDNTKTYYFHNLAVEKDTGGNWVERRSEYRPAKPVKSIELWPVVNGEPCTMLFADIKVITALPDKQETRQNATASVAVPDKSGRINIFPDGDFHNQNIIYRAIGPAKGLVRYVNEGPDGGTALLVKNSSGGNFRAYSGQVISLNQKQPMPLTFSFRGKRTGAGKTLAALDAVITFNDNTKTYYFHNLAVEEDTGGNWVERRSEYRPSKPVKSIELWPVVNGEPCTMLFADIKVLGDAPDKMSGVTQQNTVITADDWELTFANEEAFAVAGIRNRKTGQCFSGKAPLGQLQELWSLSFRLPDGKKAEVNCGQVTEIVAVSPDRREWSLRWKKQSIPGSDKKFDAEITLKITGERCEWHLNVDSSAEILEAAFPKLSSIGPLGKDPDTEFAALPQLSGKLFRNFASVNTTSLVYGAGASMQFFAFYNCEGGLYVAAHDGSMGEKRFYLNRNLDNSLMLSFALTPPGSVQNRFQYRQKFPVVTEFFRGDWYDAAQIYRKWATRQTWCRTKLSDAPVTAATDVDLWLKGGGINRDNYSYPQKSLKAIASLTPEERLKYAGSIDAPATAGQIQQLNSAIKPGKLGVWFTDNWHCGGCIGICAVNPEYQPRPGFIELAKILDDAGMPLMPYTNFGRWDTDMRDYPPEAMIRDLDGKIRTYPLYGTETGATCHSETAIRTRWKKLSNKLFASGVRGLYLDELATNGNPVCYADNHKHLPGDGTARIRAQRETLLAMRAEVADSRFFTMGEQACECYIGANDLNLWWFSAAGAIPLYEAVYHDYSIGIGRIPGKWYGRHVEKNYADPSGDSGLEELALCMGECFTSGLQLGVVRQDMFAYSRRGTKMTGDTAALRSQLHPYLIFGRFLRPAEIIFPNGTMTVKQGFHGFASSQVPLILTGSYQAPDQSIAQVFFNISAQPQRVIWKIIPEKMPELRPGKYRLKLLLPRRQPVILGVLENNGKDAVIPEMTIPAESAAAVLWESADEAVTPGFGQSSAEVNDLGVSVVPAALNIKGGDTCDFRLKLKNPSSRERTITLKWLLPDGWQGETNRKFRLASGASVNELISFLPPESAEGRFELSAAIPETGWKADFPMEIKGKRAVFAVQPLAMEKICELKQGKIPADQETFLLCQPGNANYRIPSISGCGTAGYDRENLYLLLKISGVKTPVPATADDNIWKGCCVQAAFNGRRHGAAYQLSLAAADTASGFRVYDFSTGRFTNKYGFEFCRDGNNLNYFFTIPWRELGFQQVPSGTKIGFSATYNHNEQGKFLGFLEWTKGICLGFNPNEFGDLLIK